MPHDAAVFPDRLDLFRVEQGRSRLAGGSRGHPEGIFLLRDAAVIRCGHIEADVFGYRGEGGFRQVAHLAGEVDRNGIVAGDIADGCGLRQFVLPRSESEDQTFRLIFHKPYAGIAVAVPAKLQHLLPDLIRRLAQARPGGVSLPRCGNEYALFCSPLTGVLNT